MTIPVMRVWTVVGGHHLAKTCQHMILLSVTLLVMSRSKGRVTILLLLLVVLPAQPMGPVLHMNRASLGKELVHFHPRIFINKWKFLF